MLEAIRSFFRSEKTRASIREWVESLCIAFILAMIIRTFVVQAFKIPTGSMRPTLIEGDRILVNKFIYWFREPQRGEVVVFKYPEDPKLAFIKRFIAAENEDAAIENGRIIVNGQTVEEQEIASRFYYNRGPFARVDQTTQVPPESFFVLGDNSANSRDSRYWGFVPRKNLIGKAMVIYWPPNRIRLVE